MYQRRNLLKKNPNSHINTSFKKKSFKNITSVENNNKVFETKRFLIQIYNL